MKFKLYIENYEHSKNDLHKIIQYSEKLQSMIGEKHLEDWIKAKLTHAEDYLNTVFDYLKFYTTEQKENKMSIGNLKSINYKAKEIIKIIDNTKDLKDWIKAKLNLAGEYLDDVYHHLDFKE